MALDQSQAGAGSNVRKGDLNNEGHVFEDYINVYPNPVSDRINLSINTIKRTSMRMTLVDIVGKTVVEQDYSNVMGKFETEIDIAKAQKGLYLLILNIDDQKYMQKLIKE